MEYKENQEPVQERLRAEFRLGPQVTLQVKCPNADCGQVGIDLTPSPDVQARAARGERLEPPDCRACGQKMYICRDLIVSPNEKTNRHQRRRGTLTV